MALIAAGIGATAALLGLWGAFVLDTPAGPSMISAAALIFAATSAVRRLRK